MALTKAVVPAVALLLVLGGCTAPRSRLPTISKSESIKLTSPAFRDGGRIPAAFTCDGQNLHPPVQWTGGPPAEEFALIMLDQDADEFVHWIVYGISGRVAALPAGSLPTGAKEGANSFERTGYGGPCPPHGAGPHHYLFTLYSLRLPKGETVRSGASLDEVIGAIRCCIQAEGSLVGTYGR